jgi:hypothetical protein
MEYCKKSFEEHFPEWTYQSKTLKERRQKTELFSAKKIIFFLRNLIKFVNQISKNLAASIKATDID